jgi:hypothetical protein
MSKIEPVPSGLCACGCGQLIKQVMVNGRIVQFKPGHHKVKDGNPRHSKIESCPQCKNDFKVGSRKRFCSRLCYWKSRGSSAIPYIHRWGATTVDRSKFVEVASPRLQRLYLLESVRQCEDCGWKEIVEILEMHHVDHNRKNGARANLRLLCPRCHEIRHYIEGSGRFDRNRYANAKKLRIASGLPRLPKTNARTVLQEMMDSGKLAI